MSRLWVILPFLVAGCGAATTAPDDLAGGNSADLTSTANPDLAEAEDLKRPPDLKTPPDLTEAPADMTVVPTDMTVSMSDMTGVMNDLTGVMFDLTPPDMTPPIAWGQNCSAATACAGTNGFCHTYYGRPICLNTCTTAYTLCEGGKGLCVPSGAALVCFPKCGDAENALCGAGSSCSFIGYRNHGTDGGFKRLGACFPDCSVGAGADACQPGAVCDPILRRCDVNCGGSCPTGSLCQGGTCIAASPIGAYGTCTPSATAANGCAGNFCLASGANPASAASTATATTPTRPAGAAGCAGSTTCGSPAPPA
jgi:hypothetical protein